MNFGQIIILIKHFSKTIHKKRTEELQLDKIVLVKSKILKNPPNINSIMTEIEYSSKLDMD